MIKSPLTQTSNVKCIFEQIEVPLFQNKVYPTKEQAVNCSKLPVKLYQCLDTGFVFSGEFDASKLDYDENYQNEQGNSDYFKNHLNTVYSALEKRGLLNGKIVEIGCGKGLFLDKMLEHGHNVIGVDPTYEGESERVIKEYYSEKHKDLKADLIVLRHTLEHISTPFDFLQMIAKANAPTTTIYVEIPTFEWIFKNGAIEDVFYEHCNYFTTKTIKALFTECEVVPLFNDQYIGIFAELGHLKSREELKEKEIEHYPSLFENALNKYQQLFANQTRKMIWGAGAKGSTLLNLMDPQATKVLGVIDINPKKQNKYIGGTGHLISSPEILLENSVDEIIIVNSNYTNEIEAILKNMGLSMTLKTL